MRKKYFLTMLFVVVFLINIVASGQINVIDSSRQKTRINNNIINVDDEGDGDFICLQEALNSCVTGDTIKVYSGRYKGSFIVNTSGITIKGVGYELGSGDDLDFPVIDGQGIGDVIVVNADDVVIKNLIVQNSGSSFFDLNAGIKVYSNYTEISECVVLGNLYGLAVDNSSFIEIKDNYILMNVMDGIIMYNSIGIFISGNEVNDNGFQGIFMFYVSYCTIISNSLILNDRDGLHFSDYCTNNMVYGNTINSNGIDGVKFFSSDNYDNVISDNVISSNKWNGIHFMNGHDNEILRNTLETNLNNAILFGSADENIIHENMISQNSDYALRFNEGCLNNRIYQNNIIFNTAVDYGTNIWDNGPSSGGNFWNFYSGVDSDGDGIGDSSYVIGGNGNEDRYPFMNPVYAPEIPVRPRGTRTGETGKSYTYTTYSSDLNDDSIQYGWDWDGDKEVDEWTDFYDSGVECSVSHVYSENGKYKIYVKAMDSRGLQSPWSSPLEVTMPKSKNVVSLSFIFNLFQEIIRGFFK